MLCRLQMQTLPPVVISWPVHEVHEYYCGGARDAHTNSQTTRHHIEWLCSCVSERSGGAQPGDGQHAPQRRHARRSHAPGLLPGLSSPLCRCPVLASIPHRPQHPHAYFSFSLISDFRKLFRYLEFDLLSQEMLSHSPTL